ncbi:helix-turn-helix domain-containing protein [Enterococcus sp. LJL98]
MFRITKDVWLKRDILEVLDNQSKPIYFYELLVDFPQISLSTLQKKCHELQQEVKECYPQGDVAILIDKRRGIQLVRETNNLQKIIESLIKKELPYITVKHFIFTETIDTAALCDQLSISNSKLRRQLAQMNRIINGYDLHMTVSHQIKIFGSEAMRRSLTILMLSLAHRQFSNIDWVDNQEFYLKQAMKIANYLKLPTNHSYIESIALTSFVNEQAIRRGRAVFFQNESQALIEQIDFPKKPFFLAHWDENDWIYFFLTIYSTAFSSLDLKIKKSFRETFFKSPLYLDWLQLFEKHFTPLKSEQKKQVSQNLLREHLTLSVLKINYVFFSAYTIKTLHHLEIAHPRYYHIFSDFWEAYTQLHPDFELQQTKMNNLFICQSLIPIDHYLPKIKLFMDTNLMYALEKLMEQKISDALANKYVLTFTEKVEEADFILTTYTPSLLIDIPEGKMILLEPSLSSNDFYAMEKRFDNYYQ